jgi:plasmid stability protein
MPTLYVRNVPFDLYEALRKRAKQNGRSIAAEVIALLRRFYGRKRAEVSS